MRRDTSLSRQRERLDLRVRQRAPVDLSRARDRGQISDISNLRASYWLRQAVLPAEIAGKAHSDPILAAGNSRFVFEATYFAGLRKAGVPEAIPTLYLPPETADLP